MKDATRLGNVRASLSGIVLRERAENDWSRRANKGADALRKFEDRNLLGITDVCGFVLIRFEQAVDSINQVRDVTEAASLLAVAVDGDGVAAEGLIEKIRKSAAIVQSHARAVGVEDAHDARVNGVVTVISHGQGFGEALGFIVD